MLIVFGLQSIENLDAMGKILRSWLKLEWASVHVIGFRNASPTSNGYSDSLGLSFFPFFSLGICPAGREAASLAGEDIVVLSEVTVQ
jgi:hypothetical protein